MSYEFTQNEKKATTLIGMTIAGIFLGYILSRGNFGFAGPIKKLTQQGDGRQMKSLIYLFMITSILAGVAMLTIPNSIFKYPLKLPMG
jgi:hypothetical protein